MRSMSSDEIGEMWAAIRDQTPKRARDVKFIARVRNEGWDGVLARPSRDVPPPRVIPRNEVERAKRATLKDIERGMVRFGTGPKMTVRKRKVEEAPVAIAGLLTYAPAEVVPDLGPVPKPERFEPLMGARKVHEVIATFCGPLTRRQQAEYAYICANYGVIYA